MSKDERRKELIQRQFVQATEAVCAWTFSGAHLERGAEVLRRQYNLDHEALLKNEDPEDWRSVSRPFMLLAGLTIENYLKGLCVAKSGKAFNEKQKFIYATHKLIDLAADAGVVLNDAESVFLRRLTVAVEFSSRYPSPKFPEGVFEIEGANGETYTPNCVYSQDYEFWEIFVARLKSELSSYVDM